MRMKRIKNKIDKIICLLFLLLLNSCGLRENEASFSNKLLGKWNLNTIRCYDSNYQSGNMLEKYFIPSSLEVEMVFSARNFTYAVAESSSGSGETNCITSSEGNYTINFSNSTLGKLNYKNLTTSDGCSVTLEASGVGDVDVPFGLSPLSVNVQDLHWQIEDDTEDLILQNSTNFFGSSSSSGCGEFCICYGFYTKSES